MGDVKKRKVIIMANFSALYFEFDGISSRYFLGPEKTDSLILCHTDGSGGFQNDSIEIYEPIWEDNIRKRQSLFYGIERNKHLEFEITIAALRKLTRQEINRIYTWLCSRRKLCWFAVEQGDLRKYRYRCIATECTQVSMDVQS